MGQREVLDGVLKSVAAARRAGRRPLVLLDLDDTILSTAPRHLRIMAEFAAERPRAAALLKVRADEVRYLVVETAKRAGVTDEALCAELKSFWFARFFRGEYLLSDEPVAGAPEFCAALVERGGVPVYFTGRDERMREGTLASLAKHGFPAPDGAAELILKPRFDLPDLEYKDGEMDRIRGLGDVVAGFENEPGHVNLFHDHFPEAANVFVDTRHSGKPVAVKGHLPVIKDFRLR